MATELTGLWPHGEETLIMQSGDVTMVASKTDWEWDIVSIRFDFHPTRVEIMSQAVAITNAMTIDVADDTGTPQVMVQNQALAAFTEGAADGDDIISATIADTGPFLKGQNIIFRYTTGVADTTIGTRIRIYGRPIYAAGGKLGA